MSLTHPRQFAVVASQRTGSTLLIRSLDSSPRILCAGELFHAGPGIHRPEHQFPYRMLGSRRLARFVSARLFPQRIERHLREFYAQAPGTLDAVGFKLMVSHTQTYPTIMPVLRSMNVALLYLMRADTFATALSYYKAQLSGVFHSDRESAKSGNMEISADIDEFASIFRTCKADQDRIQTLHREFGGHLLQYEDMSANWNNFIVALGERIGVPELRVEPSLSRIGASGSGVVIVNEHRLRERFADPGS